jgi:hypothetical protein
MTLSTILAVPAIAFLLVKTKDPQARLGLIAVLGLFALWWLAGTLTGEL